jgi:sugar lactone lactonase YvrE
MSRPVTVDDHARLLGRAASRRAVLAAGLALALRGLVALPLAAASRSPDPAEPALTIPLRLPSGLVVDPSGALLLAEPGGHCVWQLDERGGLTRLAGAGRPGEAGDGGPATQAELRWCHGLAIGPDGSLYLADTDNHRVRRVTPGGIIQTVAGTGERGFAGDGGSAARARLARPEGVAVGPDGALYIADTGNDRVRHVGPDGVIVTVAGAGGQFLDGPEPTVVRSGGDGGPATAAHLNWPSDVAVGPDGALYIADTFNGRIRRVDHAGVITTVAGSGRPSDLADAEPATEVWLDRPHGVAVGLDGTLLIADSGNHRVCRVERDGCLTTVAGAGARGFGGDGGPARDAFLDEPWRVAALLDGALAIADRGNGRLRRVDHQGRIATIAGSDPPTLDAVTPPLGPVTE